VPSPAPEVTGSIVTKPLPPPTAREAAEPAPYQRKVRAAIARERQREARRSGRWRDADVPRRPAARLDQNRWRERFVPDGRWLRDRRRPGVYYDPYVTVTEEYYVNGRLVRRTYRRPARPSDFR